MNAKLPGRYASMAAHQLDAVVAKLDRPIPLTETRAMTAAERRQWARAMRRSGKTQ
jgi:hypothetical protein